MRAIHRHDVRHLAHAKEGRDTGHDVLAKRRRRAEHVRVAGRQLRNLRRQNRRERLLVGRVLDHEHLADSRERCRCGVAALGRQLVEAGSYEVAGYQVGVEQGGDECAVLFATRAQLRHAQVGGVEAQPGVLLAVTGSLVDWLLTTTRRFRQPSG